MDKNSAINLIKDTFNAKFDESKFTLFIKNFLNDLEPKNDSYHSNQRIFKDSFRPHIVSYKRIGKYVDPDGEELDVLIVEVNGITKLQRARTALRNFVIYHLDKFGGKDYALVAFYSKEDEGADWRFSFIKREHKSYFDDEKQKVKIREEIVPAKRYSFLVGEYEDSHTAKNQLLPLLQNIANNPTLEELETAFSIEKVTDEFFGQYKDLFIKLSSHFENDEHIKAELKKANIDNSRFTKKLLGQIVFLYFLQKKGWLGVHEKETWGKGDKRFLQDLYKQADTNNLNYFNDYLQPLFYEALAKERNNENSYYENFNCRIPFLNGGLFEAEYNWQKANISIPEYLFRNEDKNKAGDVGTGVLDVFDRYNFTIKEDEPLDKEVAVDPEMLGKVFENMLDITERKSKGAFYTPREIVHYMCQESLIHYLDNSLEKNIKKADIETYIRKGHFALENDQRVANKGESKTYKYIIPESIRQNAELIDQKLSEIKILDPAIGSGAFPVGLLHELVNAQLVIKPHFSEKYTQEKLLDFGFNAKETDISESRYVYRLKRHIIQESIYGVDIDASAIDIARLRLWLSLVVDEDDFDPIETLPNLDYKIVCGNSLISRYDIDMPIEKVFKEFNKGRDDKMDLDKYKALVNAFMDESDHDKKEEFRTLIAEIKSAFKTYFSQGDLKSLNKLKSKLSEYESVGLFGANKTTAEKKRIKELKATITKKEKERNDIEQAKIYENAIEWRFEFPNLLNDNGDFVGFDVVIGNPPYVLLQDEYRDKIALDFFKTNYLVASYKVDLYHLFFEKACNLNNNNGNNIFITPTNYQSNNYSKTLRRFLLKNGLNHIIVLDGKVFNASVNTSITNINKSRGNKLKFEKAILDNYDDLKITEIGELDYDFFNTDDSLFIPPLNKESALVMSKIETKNSEMLNLISTINFGMQLRDRKKHPMDVIQNPDISLLTEFHRKCYTGKDIKAFKLQYANRYCYYNRKAKKGGCWNDDAQLAKDKILVPQIGRYPIGAIDRKGYPILNTAFMINLFSSGESENVLAQLNSDIIAFIWLNKFRDERDTFPKIKGSYLGQLPIINNSHNCLTLIIRFLENLTNTGNSELLTSFFISVSNAVVYELYFPEELKTANKEILKHLGDLKPITDEMSEEEKLAIIQSEFERLYDPNHPVRNNIETLDSIEEVRIIKEALK